jgi:hypothetical protein
MKPNSAYTAVSALPYHFNGHIRVCGNHYAIDLTWQRGDVRIAECTLNFRGARVDWKNVVAGVSQPSEYSVGWLAPVSGDPCDADALATKEVGNGMRNTSHRDSPLLTTTTQRFRLAGPNVIQLCLPIVTSGRLKKLPAQ